MRGSALAMGKSEDGLVLSTVGLTLRKLTSQTVLG